MCDENGIGGDGEYCRDSDAQFDRAKIFYHEASGGKCVPRAVFMDLKPGVIDAVRSRPATRTCRRYIDARINLPLFT